MTAPVLSLDRVAVRLGGRDILHAVSLDIPHGALSALVGVSGCGKTTLIRLCAGLIPESAGRVTRGFTHAGIVFQSPRLLPWRTALDNAALGGLAGGAARAERRRDASALLMRCGLNDSDMGKYPHALSGGMQARVAIARALAGDPDILLFDEPFNGLDTARRAAMQDLVRDLVDSRAATGLFVTHDLAEERDAALDKFLASPAVRRTLATDGD